MFIKGDAFHPDLRQNNQQVGIPKNTSGRDKNQKEKIRQIANVTASVVQVMLSFPEIFHRCAEIPEMKYFDFWDFW